MSIRKRLLISNLSMLIVPVLISLMVIGSMLFIFSKVAGVREDEDKLYGKLLHDSILRIEQLTGNTSSVPDLERFIKEAELYNELYREQKFQLAIYRGEELLYPAGSGTVDPMLRLALSEPGEHLYTRDQTVLYGKRAGELTLIVTGYTNKDLNEFRSHEEYEGFIYKFGLGMSVLVIFIIWYTNRYLTRFVFRSIMTPLNALKYGVHQIRDGNLDYRIGYQQEDEFQEICEDFNEMAQRLHDSVQARHKDESNRKELIAGISHDLKTPLTSIKAYLEGLELGVAATEEAKKRYFEIIKQKTNDMQHIIHQLFHFSKLDIGEFPLYMEPLDIGQELSQLVAASLDEYSQKGLVLRLNEVPDRCFVLADPVQLRSAILNILANSLKYKEQETGRLEIALRTDGDHAVLTLTDNGPGVPEESVGKLFDVFYRSDPSRTNSSQGSGIGLAITAKIMERFGGSIQAENAVGGGLTVRIILPLMKEGQML